MQVLKDISTNGTKIYGEVNGEASVADIATTETAGIVKPDGTSVTIDLDGTIHASGTSSGVSSVNTRTGAVTLSKSDVGLSNADNTSDVNKPISTATQTALNGKQASGTYSTDIHSNITALNAVSGTNTGDQDISTKVDKETGKSLVLDTAITDLTDGGATILHKHSYNNLDDKPTIPTDKGIFYVTSLAELKTALESTTYYTKQIFVSNNGTGWDGVSNTTINARGVNYVNGYVGINVNYGSPIVLTINGGGSVCYIYFNNQFQFESQTLSLAYCFMFINKAAIYNTTVTIGTASALYYSILEGIPLSGTITQLNWLVDSSNFVHKTGNETLSGVKSFASFPITPSEMPTADYQVANKKYIDDKTAEDISYDPTLADPLLVSTTVQGAIDEFADAYLNDSLNFAHKTGDETITGIKTFSSSPIVPTPTTDMQTATKKYVDDNAGGNTSGWLPISATLAYSSADIPTFVVSTSIDLTGQIGLGNRIKLTQTTDKYFIVTAITSTTITLYGGTDHTLANATITNPYFSNAKAPFGFSIDPTKWTVVTTDTTGRSQATPTVNVWYNLGGVAITIPIGIWNVKYSCLPYSYRIAIDKIQWEITLSTANNSASDASMTRAGYAGSLNSAAEFGSSVDMIRPLPLVLTSKTIYYINTRTINTNMASLNNQNATQALYITAVCAYL